ncbi:MAG: hypothetical protein RJA57_139 [Bacteroidota bacterium]
MWTRLRHVPILLLLLLPVTQGNAQQEAFDSKLNAIYVLNTTDKKKALESARALLKEVERKQEWQTIPNYYILKNLFEQFTVDAALARTCAERAEKLSRDLVGQTSVPTTTGTDSSDRWFNTILPGLYQTKDPENARKALEFLDRYASFRTFSNYTAIGYAFERNGDFTSAQRYYELALPLAGDEKKEHVAYLNYILFLAKSGDYQRAESYIRRTETLAQTAETDLIRRSYYNEGLSARTLYYFFIGDYESYVKASDKQFEELAKLYAQYGMSCTGQEFIRLTNAALATENLKNFDLAEQYWRRRDSAYAAWLTCQKERYPNVKLNPSSLLPVFLMKRGLGKKLSRPVSFYINETKTYYNTFREYADITTDYFKATQLAHLRSPDYTDAFAAVLKRIRSTRDFRESTRPFADLAYFQMRDGNTAGARETYRELFNLNRGWINDILFAFGEKTFVTYFNAKLKEGYENFHSFVKKVTDRNGPDPGALTGQAYDNLLLTKSLSLQGVKKRKEAFIQSSDPAVVRLYEDWLDRKQQLIRLYFKSAGPASGSAPDSAEARRTGEQLEKLQSEVNTMENELSARSKDFKRLLRIDPPDWQAVKSRLREGEAAVEIVRFQWRDQQYYSDSAFYAAYIITAGSPYPRVVYLPQDAFVMDNDHYKAYKNYIRFKVDDPYSYDRYWKPIREAIPDLRKVYFSADGIYHLINLSTLRNPRTGLYVLDETEIISTTSTGDLLLAGTARPDNRTAVLIGRPSYRTTTVSDGARPADDGSRSFIGSFQTGQIADLPGTEAEVLTIKKELEDKNIRVNCFLREAATEERLQQVSSPGILHVATHGYWSGTSANATSGYRSFNAMVNSGLLLSGVENYYDGPEFPDTYDGVLTAYEAQNLNLGKTSMVILSACETNLGYLDAGEGVYGLQRAFRAAGAASIMTSLWKVDDNATRDFMIAFYRHYLTHGNKAAAFTTAQKTIRDTYRFPYYWGAFVLVGE